MLFYSSKSQRKKTAYDVSYAALIFNEIKNVWDKSNLYDLCIIYELLLLGYHSNCSKFQVEYSIINPRFIDI